MNKQNNTKITWLKHNKKKIIIISGVVIAVGMSYIGYTAYRLSGGKTPNKYSSKWFDTVSDDVLNAEREIVRKQWLSCGDDISLADSMYNLLIKFDNVISKRAWGKIIPHGSSYHREHGYNLYKKD